MTAVPPPAIFIAPSRNKKAWEQLRIKAFGVDGIAPGIVTIGGADIEDEYDVKEAQGQDGATAERKGEKPKNFTSTHWLSDVPDPSQTYDPVEGVAVVDDHVQFGAFFWLLRLAMKSKPPKAISVEHPKLAFKEITAGVPTKIAGPDPAEDGSTLFVVDWHVYDPVVKGSGEGLQKPDARTQADDDIDRELKEYERLQDEWERL